MKFGDAKGMYGNSRPPNLYDDTTKRRGRNAEPVAEAEALSAGVVRKRRAAGFQGWTKGPQEAVNLPKVNSARNAGERLAPRDTTQAAVRALRMLEAQKNRAKPMEVTRLAAGLKPGRGLPSRKVVADPARRGTARKILPRNPVEDRALRAQAADRAQRRAGKVKFEDDWTPENAKAAAPPVRKKKRK